MGKAYPGAWNMIVIFTRNVLCSWCEYRICIIIPFYRFSRDYTKLCMCTEYFWNLVYFYSIRHFFLFCGKCQGWNLVKLFYVLGFNFLQVKIWFLPIPAIYTKNTFSCIFHIFIHKISHFGLQVNKGWFRTKIDIFTDMFFCKKFHFENVQDLKQFTQIASATGVYIGRSGITTFQMCLALHLVNWHSI